MIEFLNSYGPQIIATGVILVAYIPTSVIRNIKDGKILDVFRTAKSTIIENKEIKVDIKGSIIRFDQTLDTMKTVMTDQTNEFERVILEFQEGELYQKMLIGAEQVAKINEVLKQKDETISLLGKSLKKLTKDIAEIKNTLKG